MAKLSGLSGASSGADEAQNTGTDIGFEPSPQQSRIFLHTAARASNLIIEARAGTGKTTTLVQASKHLKGGAAFLAFNKGIASEIERKLASEGIDWKQVKAATFHSVGFSAWSKQYPECKNNVKGEKLSLLCDKIGVPKNMQTFCRQLVSLAKQSCIGISPQPPMDDDQVWLDLIEHFSLMDLAPAEGVDDLDEWLEQALAWSLRLLRESISTARSCVDFDDMIYMPLYENTRFWQYETVMIDEAQDTNFARRAMSKQLLRPGGMLVAVGDRHQAIYGFTGADADALDLIEHDFRTTTLPLTVTYRCAKEIVTVAQQWVPDIEARPDAPQGIVRGMTSADFDKFIPEPHDAILCRLTAPLVQIAFRYLRRHIPCHVEGREIGGALIGFIKKFKTTSIHELEPKLTEHLERERDRLIHQHKYAQLAQLEDKVSTILVLADGFDPTEGTHELTGLITSMFKDSDGLAKQTITLSTIHKAKGREWDRVFILGRAQLMPSSWAKQDWELVQEQNLMYVAVTRARYELVDVELADTKKRR